ncbi:MAG: DNA replication/repair protein RecF [Oscillospiraceae bacterium]
MKLENLKVKSYRNIDYAEFTPSDGLTVICGKNGQGKTNMLESIWLLTGAKSFRGSKDTELVKKGEEFALIDGICKNENKKSNLHISIGTELSLKKGRYAKENGVDAGRATNLAGIFTAVVFEPGHLSLVKGSPEGRRKFIDAAICQLYPSYISVLRKYARLVTQKNSLLKSNESMQYKNELLDVFDKGICECGYIISNKRLEYISLLKSFAVNIYKDLSKNSEELNINYEQCFKNGEINRLINKSRETDLRAGFCTEGPHREDFNIYLGNKDAKAFASQGQQRSCVLSLKMAEAAVAKNITGEHPVMLLDDVLSELDFERQEYLLCEMRDKQTVVTSCDPQVFVKTSGAIYEMAKGVLIKKE